MISHFSPLSSFISYLSHFSSPSLLTFYISHTSHISQLSYLSSIISLISYLISHLISRITRISLISIISIIYHLSSLSSLSSSLSQVASRRRKLAQNVALDAKFLKFTSRLTQNSALALPQRTPSAPLNGTEERYSIMRAITSQGKEYDLFNKYKKADQLAKFMGGALLVACRCSLLIVCCG